MSDRKLALLESSLPFEDVATEEWAELGWPVVRVRTMGSDDYDEWEALVLGIIGRAKLTGESPLKGQRAALVTCSACDPETGERSFTAADVAKVGTLNGNVLNRLCAVSQKLNPTSAEDQRELEKNSEGGRIGFFSSASRWLSAAPMWTALVRSFRRDKLTSGAPSSGSKAIH